ncbi:MAG TPA: glycosyltransferase family A protein [Kaistella chaponensis]|uniref:glycosyltransferase family 2 protein n=1 Tax=Kaistella chaponensis TaxID=713588 RepID=UPI002B5A5443|nr:glycosyltransferase family A protein [Kaistella chaponensis]HPW87847.1 glycosyltransferase family A protein [Kaistella chaponensis]HQC06424.1 glycosyltransferase family A protein [Kaistella chaponensis]
MISVIIPVYNAEKSIEKSLISIKNQTWEGVFEIILVNDGSSDRSKTIIENYQQNHQDQNIILINQENRGVSKARNAAMKIAQGDYIALLDSDDEWLPEKTEKQMKFLENQNIDFITSLWNNENITFPYKLHPPNKLVKITLKKLLFKITGQTSTAIFKRKIFENTGFFDENQNYSEDANYWMRISEKNQMYILPEKLVIAGNGKKSFGFSGLSANLKEMEKGIQKNIWEMYQTKRINFPEYLFYFVISKLKFAIRPLRAKL